ncbi:MAG: hypothetical protein KatS3mg105_0369 [Gemmatales bacterium]|nr:MAG: hypothetical protein KatS3mg105_0369 [Gemmatales bacterium]
MAESITNEAQQQKTNASATSWLVGLAINYVWIALICTLLKIAGFPLFRDESWTTALVWGPAVAIGILLFHEFCVQRLLKRLHSRKSAEAMGEKKENTDVTQAQ